MKIYTEESYLDVRIKTSTYIKKYLNLNYKVLEAQTEEHLIELRVEEKKDLMVIYLPVMTVHFDNKIKEAVKQYWNEKKINIKYDSKIKLNFYTFKEFQKNK